MEELKACPFCGNSIAVRVLDQNEVEYREEGDSDYADHPYYQVVCCINDDSPVPTPGWVPGCGASGGFRKTPEKAIAAWNHRAAPENKALTLEELKRMNADMVNRPWVWIEADAELFDSKLVGPAYYQVQYGYDHDKAFCCGYPGLSYRLDYADYGKTWIAYARRPEAMP